MPVRLQEEYTISLGDTEVVSIDFTDHLDSGELLTGTPTVVDANGTDNLTLGNKAINTATYVDANRGTTVAVGAAVQFSITASATGEYTINVTVSTDATIARTFKRELIINFI